VTKQGPDHSYGCSAPRAMTKRKHVKFRGRRGSKRLATRGVLLGVEH